MNSARAELPIPGLLWGDRPERRVVPRTLRERGNALLRAAADRIGPWARARDRAFVAGVREAESALADAVDHDGGVQALQQVRQGLLRHGLQPRALQPCFALVCLLVQRHVGRRPYDSQLIAARAVVDGCLAEMATGEGKTLAVGLAAAAAALAGMPVHVVTANDYLVARDAETLAPLYAALGLRVGCVVQADDDAQRATAYGCDIAYVTARELVFDYLRDGLAGGRAAAPTPALARLWGAQAAPRLLRGLCMAIIDEADAVLIDEARMPLILSQPAGADGLAEAHDHAAQALHFARSLQPGVHFTLDGGALQARLTPAGAQCLAAAAAALDGASASAAWRQRRHREHAVCTALVALHALRPDRHYLVRDGQVVIVDETTGRRAEGRVWAGGLQQLVEIKEGCEPTPAMATVAQITFQRFFPRYLRLGGLSGTLKEARAELLARYGLSVRAVPLRLPGRRRVGASRLFADHAALWAAVAARVAALQARGLPVLVATDSVAETQALSQVLNQAGLPHAVLHARDHADEARVVAGAGQRGAVTVTTNMAGRGTDIALADGVADLGGLQLICCQLNAARRIDRQLAGRAARQGDPGAVATWLSLDSTLIRRFWPAPLRRALAPLAATLPPWAVRLLARLPQCLEESRQREQRDRLVRQDIDMERALAFAGRAE